jgi:hypothetical protein
MAHGQQQWCASMLTSIAWAGHVPTIGKLLLLLSNTAVTVLALVAVLASQSGLTHIDVYE